MTDPVLVDHSTEPHGATTGNNTNKQSNIKPGTSAKNSAPHGKQISTHGGSAVYRHYRAQGLSREVSQTLTLSRADNTYSQYQVYFQKWNIYCSKREIDPKYPSLNDCLQFLHDLKASIGYSGIATAKAALNTFIKIDGKYLGKHELVTRFMLGIAKQLPRVPKYSSIWDPDQVVAFLKQWSPARKLNLLQLSAKTATLILLVTGQRPQILHYLDLHYMEIKNASVTFTITQNLKHTRGNAPATTLALRSYHDKRVCVITYIRAYLARVEKIRNDTAFFISTTKPHKAATQSTLSRWVKLVLQKSGINVHTFGAGSTRAATANAAFRKGVPLQTIMTKAAWKSKSTFFKWYLKPSKTTENYQKAILGKSTSDYKTNTSKGKRVHKH